MKVTKSNKELLLLIQEDDRVAFYNAPEETVVSGKLTNGKLTALKIVPQSREKDLVVYSSSLNQ